MKKMNKPFARIWFENIDKISKSENREH